MIWTFYFLYYQLLGLYGMGSKFFMHWHQKALLEEHHPHELASPSYLTSSLLQLLP